MRALLFFVLVLLSCNKTLYCESLRVPVRATSAILYNPDNGAILYQKEAHKGHYPASIMKLATALFVIEEQKMALSSLMKTSPDAIAVMAASVRQANPLNYPAHILEYDGVRFGLEVGETYTLNDLIYALLLHSSNDVANVIAENSSGSVHKFMKELNEFLRKKGTKGTHLANPHGLFHPAQITTAYDMALIGGWVLESELLTRVLKTPTYTLADSQGNKERTIKNFCSLISEGKYQYPKAIGGKTGYIASAGFNLIAFAEEGGRKLVAVLLGCDKAGRYEDAIALFEKAFLERPKTRTLFEMGQPLFAKKGYLAGQTLNACLQKELTYTYFPSEERDLKADIYWKELSLPIQVGTEVGEVVVRDLGGREVTRSPTFAANRVEKSPLALLLRLLSSNKWGLIFLCLIPLLLFGRRKLREKGPKRH